MNYNRGELIICGNFEFPYVEINNKDIPINNLHIHCKDLKKFRMDRNII